LLPSVLQRVTAGQVWIADRNFCTQGSVLAQQDFLQVGLANESNADLAVAVSHDCDIANANLEAQDISFKMEVIIIYVLYQQIKLKQKN
jgi:hypothetical protein